MAVGSEEWTAERVSALVGAAGDLRNGLSPQAVSILMGKGMVRAYPKGAMILERDASEPKFFLALSGQVRLTALTEDGREFVSAFMHPGKIWGVHPCLDGTPETHDSKAETDCEVLVLAAAAVRELMWENRELQEAMTEILCKRLRLALNVLEQFATWNPRQRLAWRILQIVKGMIGNEVGDTQPAIAISQEAIAAMIGLSRQRTNKLLKEFEREKLVKIDYGSICVLNPRGLEIELDNLSHF